MPIKVIIRAILLWVTIAVFGCNEDANRGVYDGYLRIAAAANISGPIHKVNKAFESHYPIKCEVITASSGKLTAQIIEGAPFDIFLSANMKYPQTLVKEHMVLLDSISIYAQGTLVLCSYELKQEQLNLDSLTNKGIEQIAIANDKNAPYGTAAIEALRNFGIYDSIRSKLVYGESVSQVNQYILTKSVDVGITNNAIVHGRMANANWTEIPVHHYHPIEQGIVKLINGEADKTIQEKYFRFIFTDEARAIFKEFGYLVK